MSDKPVIPYGVSPPRAGVGSVVRSMGRSARRSMSRENLVQLVKTLAWVVPLTLLIWVYADREQRLKQEVQVPVELRSALHDCVVQAPKDASHSGTFNFTVELEGPRANIDKVRELVMPALLIELDSGYSPGQSWPVNVTRALNASALFKRYGVEALSATPSTVTVYIDQIGTETAPVVVPEGQVNLAGNPTFDPPTVTLTGPKRTLKVLKDSQRLKAFAELEGRDELRTPGEHTLASVAIRPLYDPDLPANTTLSWTPATVRATLTVREADEKTLLTSVPIWVVPDPSLIDKYRFQNPPAIANVNVTGPAIEIESLRKQQFIPKAYLIVTRDMTENPGIPRQVRLKFDLPGGVTPSGEDLQRTVELTVTQRTETEQ